MVTRSSGPNDKSSELDLEMHLSSVSGRRKSVKSRQQNVHDPLGSKITVAVGGTTVTPQDNSSPHSQQGDKNPPAGSCELASSAHPLVVPNDNITRYDVDDIGDNSHLGIVMEQEELSDSEEDIEEHVEFECEEMADSEGEDGSGCEQAPEVQNKEFPTSEENVAKHPACIKNPRDLRVGSDAQLGDSLLNDASTLNMAFARGGYDGKNNSSWLSLDSSSSDNPMLSKTNMNMNMETGAISESLASKNLAIGKAITEERSPIDMVQQPAVGPLVFDTPRKPRKRSGKSNTNFDTGFPDEIPSLDSNNKDG
ncbi:hypothetical protein PIB30_046036 [Stylosanthes scabra]|uniref:Uncharacterized protein n=1 Tax=Stylosanthes scabra TaxID=79078 RepID=A0ABU6ZF45_9FABA|nr:hypothetical protein [Stylosanthes scabra]